MSKRNLLIVLILAAAAAAIIWYLKPCGPQTPNATGTPGTAAPAKITEPPKNQTAPQANVPSQPVQPAEAKKEAPVAAEKNPPVPAPAPAEVDTAPPVVLTSSEQIPEVARCATANFPGDAKPYVKMAVVTVRLVVDKFGNVRSVTPLDVEFPQEVAEDVLPQMRKSFIKAGSRAFGAKKCPPHVVNGQNVGYSIEVPLQYKH